MIANFFKQLGGVILAQLVIPIGTAIAWAVKKVIERFTKKIDTPPLKEPSDSQTDRTG